MYSFIFDENPILKLSTDCVKMYANSNMNGIVIPTAINTEE